VDKDEMILVSVDDHVIEPPDMFERHLPEKWAGDAPHVVTQGTTNQWMYRGKPAGLVGLNAVVGWPPLEWNSEPSGFAEMRPGAYDIHSRVRDMDRNGVLASMCFPTFAGFSGGHLIQFRDETTAAVIQAYNDWHIDEWCATCPGGSSRCPSRRSMTRRRPSRRSGGSRRRAPGASPCPRCRTSTASRATTTRTTGSRSGRPCLRRAWPWSCTSAWACGRSRSRRGRRATTR